MVDVSTPVFLATLLVVAVAALVCGGAVGWLASRARSADDRRAASEQIARTEAESNNRQSILREELATLSGELRAAHDNAARTQEDLDWQRRQNGELEKRMAPLREAFETLRAQVDSAERRRIKSDAELGQTVSRMATDFGEATRSVRDEARKLSTVLSRTERRGAWGEMQLRGLVESSGLVRHVHFVEQDQTSGDAGNLRPDLVVDLTGGRKVVVDSKVPLDAFLRLDSAPSDSDALMEHGRLVHQHIQSLSTKEYWRRYNSPEFVVMFLPSEGLLSAALEARPDLIQQGIDRRVLLATPTTLLAMLHTISHAWRQVEAAQQAHEIHAVGVELYQRLLAMAERIDGVGRAIGRSVAEYNKLVGTLESRVLPSGRRMQAFDLGGDQVSTVDQLVESPRPLRAGSWDDPEGQSPRTDHPEIFDPQCAAPSPDPKAADDSAA